MNEARLIFLYQQYIDDRSSAEELQELELLLTDPEYEAAFTRLLDGTWEEFNADDPDDLTENKADQIYRSIIESYTRRKSGIRLWFSIAASVLLCISIGLAFYPTGLPEPLQKPSPKPIFKVNGELTTVVIPKGGEYQLMLADGTRIFLNSASSLSYPVRFTGTERKVILKGEAYFEVTKDRHHPFVVQTDKQTVTVLGTHFNISSYADEASEKTTLLEGRVSVVPRSLEIASSRRASRNYRGEVILKPGEQSVIKNNSIQVNKADLTEAIAWKNDLFIFNNENITSIMKKISRWYGVEVVFNGNMEHVNLYGNYSRAKSLDNLLKNIELMGKVDFRMEGRRITVSNK